MRTMLAHNLIILDMAKYINFSFRQPPILQSFNPKLVRLKVSSPSSVMILFHLSKIWLRAETRVPFWHALEKFFGPKCISKSDFKRKLKVIATESACSAIFSFLELFLWFLLWFCVYFDAGGFFGAPSALSGKIHLFQKNPPTAEKIGGFFHLALDAHQENSPIRGGCWAVRWSFDTLEPENTWNNQKSTYFQK